MEIQIKMVKIEIVFLQYLIKYELHIHEQLASNYR